MENKEEFTHQLQAYREAIDAIDTQLLNLFKQRSLIVANVGELKSRHGVHGSYIRAGREAMMLRNLLDAAGDTLFPKSAIAAIWRIIIGSSTALESPLNTITFADDAQGVHAAAQYFGPQVENRSLCETEFFKVLEENPHSIAVVPYDLQATWWQKMPDLMRVFACMPFVGATPTHLALGQVVPEATGDDISLFYDYNTKTVLAYKGFHSAETPCIASDKEVLHIGSYAVPYGV